MEQYVEGMALYGEVHVQKVETWHSSSSGLGTRLALVHARTKQSA